MYNTTFLPTVLHMCVELRLSEYKKKKKKFLGMHVCKNT